MKWFLSNSTLFGRKRIVGYLFVVFIYLITHIGNLVEYPRFFPDEMYYVEKAIYWEKTGKPCVSSGTWDDSGKIILIPNFTNPPGLSWCLMILFRLFGTSPLILRLFLLESKIEDITMKTSKHHSNTQTTGNAAMLVVIDSAGSYWDYFIVKETMLDAFDHFAMPYRILDLAKQRPDAETLNDCACIVLAQHRICSAFTDKEADRIAEAVKDMDADIVVNIQGDEPLLNPKHIDKVMAPLVEEPDLNVSVLVTPYEKKNSVSDIKAV